MGNRCSIRCATRATGGVESRNRRADCTVKRGASAPRGNTRATLAESSPRERKLCGIAHGEPAHERSAVERLLAGTPLALEQLEAGVRECPRLLRGDDRDDIGVCPTSGGREGTLRRLGDDDDLPGGIDEPRGDPQQTAVRERLTDRRAGVLAHSRCRGSAIAVPCTEPPGRERCGGDRGRIRRQVSVGLIGRGRDAVLSEQRIALDAGEDRIEQVASLDGPPRIAGRGGCLLYTSPSPRDS